MANRIGVVDVAQPLFAGEPRNLRPSLRPAPARAARKQGPSVLHLHWFRWTGADAFSGSSLYTCRCGQARSSL